jgi:hypothetical protein
MKRLGYNNTKYKIPFDNKGNQLSYNDGWRGVKEKKNFFFEDSMKITDYERGRSSATFIAVSETDGKEYSMFMKETLKLLQNADMKKGVFNGQFTFRKSGANFSLALVTEDEAGFIKTQQEKIKMSEPTNRLDDIE